jgi:hypothetical protein
MLTKTWMRRDNVEYVGADIKIHLILKFILGE